MTKTILPNNNHLSKIFFEIIGNLDLDEIFKRSGRPYLYSTKSIIKTFLIMVAHRLTSARSLARFLEERQEIAKVCQFKDNKVPSYRTFCRRFKCLDNWIIQWSRIIITFLVDSKILKLKILIIDDAGYNYQWSKQLNIRLTCPLNMANKLKGERLKRWKFYKSRLGQKLYQRRTDVERLNGHLKDLFLIGPFPVKRLKNVNAYLNLAILLYLAGVYHNFTNGRNLREIKSLIA